jgi:hypothetical protein
LFLKILPSCCVRSEKETRKNVVCRVDELEQQRLMTKVISLLLRKIRKGGGGGGGGGELEQQRLVSSDCSLSA